LMPQYSSIAGASLGTFLADLVACNLESVLAASESERVASEPVKALAGADVEGLIAGCSEPVQAMAWRFARSSDGRVEADELYSIGMLEICEALTAGRGLGADNPVAYLCGAARFAMIAEWRRLHNWSTISLDAPLSDNTASTLLDILPAPAAALAATPDEVERAQEVRGAVRRLTPRRRAAVRYCYGLESSHTYTAKDASRKLRVSSAKIVNQLNRRAFHSLRADARLCAVVGVEVQA
jgi:DNA-directed RNA polymerase specialized sigma24 family protein